MIKFLKDVTSPSYKKYLFFIFSWWFEEWFSFLGWWLKSKIILKLQKWVIWIIDGVRRYTSNRQHFKDANILQYLACTYKETGMKCCNSLS
jgi:hypothetical protein